MFCVKVDGFSQEWKPDTVAARDIMDEEHLLSFENKLGRKIKLSPSSIKLFAFGNRQNLNIIGKFNAVLRAGVRSVYSTIFVTKERYQYPLLCEDSLYKLGLISFNKKFITYQMKRTRRSVVVNPQLIDGSDTRVAGGAVYNQGRKNDKPRRVMVFSSSKKDYRWEDQLVYREGCSIPLDGVQDERPLTSRCRSEWGHNNLSTYNIKRSNDSIHEKPSKRAIPMRNMGRGDMQNLYGTKRQLIR